MLEDNLDMPKDAGTERLLRILALSNGLVTQLGKNVTVDWIFDNIGEYRELGSASDRSEKKRRTVLQRDIRFLKDSLGMDISYSKPAQSYKISSSGKFALYLRLTHPELETLFTGVTLLKHFFRRSSTESLIKKLYGVMPEKYTECFETLDTILRIADFPIPQPDITIFSTALHCIYNNLRSKEKHRLDFDYDSLRKEDRKHFQIIPYALFFRHYTWFIYAIVIDKSDQYKNRNFRLTSISNLRESPFPLVGKILDLCGQKTPSFALLTGCEEGTNIEVRISDTLFEVLCESVPEMKEYCTLEEDTHVLRTKVPSLEGCARWILDAHPHVSVIGPKELQEELFLVKEKLHLNGNKS